MPFSNPYLYTTSSNQKCLVKTDRCTVSDSPSKVLLNITFSVDRIYHHNGIAYDFYSKNDIGQSKAGNQWRVWTIPDKECLLKSNISVCCINMSPLIESKLPFVNTIYVLTDMRSAERHANLKNAFHRQGITLKLIEWSMKWNRSRCISASSHRYICRRLNLKNKALGNYRLRKFILSDNHLNVNSLLYYRRSIVLQYCLQPVILFSAERQLLIYYLA